MQTTKNERLTMARLYGQMHRGQLTRREMLQKGAVAGIGAATLALFAGNGPSAFAAQGAATPSASPDAVAAAETIVVPDDLRTDLSGTRIAAVLADSTSPDLQWQQAAIDKFSEATGIVVEIVPGETSATDRLQVYNQQFAAEASDIDVYQIDVIWPGVVAEHAIDLSEPLGNDIVSQHFPAIVENNTVDDKLVGLPWFTDAGLLYFRTDLLEQYGLEAPTTWDELTSAAQTIQEGERANNPDFFGFVFQGKAYEGLTCNGLEWQASYGGGTIVESDGTVSVNNEQAITAFELAASWIDGIAPEGVTTYEEPDSLNVWLGGNAAFMRNWPYAFAASQDPQSSQVVGNVGVSPLPMGNGDNARRADTLGGWQLMVSQYSENQEAGIEFVKYMCSPEVQKSYAVERSHLPTIESVYDDPDVAQASEFIPRLRDVFVQGAVARPSSVTSFLYPEVSAVYYQNLNSILTGAKDAATGAADMESDIQELVDELGL